MRRETKQLEILNLLTLIQNTDGLEHTVAEHALSALTGGTCHALTISMGTLMTCLQRTCDPVPVLDGVEHGVTVQCNPMTLQTDDGGPQPLQRRLLKRRAVHDTGDDGCQVRCTRGEY